MRTARYTGMFAVAMGVHGFAAFAGEGSDLRGLKPPSSAFEAHRSVQVVPSTGLGLKRSERHVFQDFGSAVLLSGGTLADRRIATAEGDYRFTLHQPVGQDVPALAEPNIHTLHDVLPRYTLNTEVVRAMPGGWGLGFGVRQTEYNFATSNLLSLSAERHWGKLRGAYTLYANRAEGAGLGSAHRFQVSYLYGERNVIGLAYTTGREFEHSGLPVAHALSDMRDWTLSGRHWLSPNWALTYDLLSSDQGAFYRRPGLRLGVSRSF